MSYAVMHATLDKGEQVVASVCLEPATPKGDVWAFQAAGFGMSRDFPRDRYSVPAAFQMWMREHNRTVTGFIVEIGSTVG